MKTRRRNIAASFSSNETLLQTAQFRAKLKNSLVLTAGSGDPSFSRGTAAWRFNERGFLRTVPSGCAVFDGARLVRNTVRTKSEDFSNAAWTKTALTCPSANVLLCANSSAQQYISQSGSPISLTLDNEYVFGCRVKYVSGGIEIIQLTGLSSGFGTGQYANFSILSGNFNAVGCTAKMELVAESTYDISIRVVATASGNYDAFSISIANDLSSARLPVFAGDGVKSCEIYRAWSYNVTGYPSTYVPEYVSVGVVASPYFGAGIDGAKYFDTDGEDRGISESSLKGFRRETAETNNLLWCRDLAGATATELASGATTKAWVPTVTGSTLVTNGTFDTDLTGWTNNGSSSASVVSGSMRLDSTGGGGGRYQDLSLTVGKTYYLTSDVTMVSGSGSVSALVYPDNTISTAVKYNLFSVSGSAGIIFKSTSALQRVYFSCNSVGRIVDIDNVVCKEVSCIPERTATGLDGLNNTATTLTFVEANSTILQPITLSSAARCASAYVRRKTGTGTISFTQDGGSSWTDITSLINSNTYTRVQITATLANPSVGFKGSTAGDVIEVDVVQNEAGTVATSPILTTTAAVTRNAEILTYPVSGNLDFTVGTLIGSIQSSGSVTTRHFLSMGTSYSYISSAQANTDWRVTDGVNVMSMSGLDDLTAGRVKRALSWSGATMSMTGNGVPPTSGTFDGTFGDGTTIDIGLNMNGSVRDVAIWNVALTNAQLQALTA